MSDVVELHDPAERSRVAEAVLRDLPGWFGIEDATRGYVEEAAALPTFVAPPDRGFVCVKQHTPRAAELYVMGVRRGHHRQGLGRALVAAAESWCRARGIRFLQVKTLGPSHPDDGYAATRAFYEALGFVPTRGAPDPLGREQSRPPVGQGRRPRLLRLAGRGDPGAARGRRPRRR